MAAAVTGPREAELLRWSFLLWHAPRAMHHAQPTHQGHTRRGDLDSHDLRHGQSESRQLVHVADSLTSSHSRVAEMLRDAMANLTAFSHFPLTHWLKIWSTKPLSDSAKR